ncbi:pectate lyase-like protein [Breznakibacter xylanolyticus]|uniref:Pectate lyase-like protein n=1 Tax=Breznakibacter xylanolyticus TaxID=990 RepID=A0A2W7P1U2_9BACT|nr:glycoside hydrolase family 28 protein [Breznakibacter xylanolyticus]MBN2742879.1 glycoside hydrolase family 28 protein [Marinilabiliaceae bacterium]PZX19396.1 pectate lyase-like protein [Breznakibacter xylanolyticus]
MNKRFAPLMLAMMMNLSACHQAPKTADAQTIAQSIVEPVIPALTLLVTDYGAVGDSLTDCKPAIDAAIAHLSQKGGGTLRFTPGTYTVNGPIHMVSRMALHLDSGAVVRFGSNPADYLPVVKTSWEGTFLYNYSPMIYALDCHDVAITGQGTLDGEAAQTWATWHARQKDDQQLSRHMNHNRVPLDERIFGQGHYLRPQMIQFYGCQNVKVEGVMIEDSPFWCLHLLMCDNVVVRNVRYNAHNKNNDGIDPEYSRNVLIEGVQFNNADDNVAIKAGRDHEGRDHASHASHNIVVRNCHFKGLHALVIGSEMSAGVHNVYVSNCTYAGYLKRGIYLKSNPDRGGYIRDIYVDQVTFDNVEDCIYITSYYHNEGSGHATHIGNINFSNIRCQRAHGTGIVLQGFADKPLSDVHLSNITIDTAANAISMEYTRDIVLSNVTLGKPATAPSHVQ